MFPFGLRSAPKIFTAVADALDWCLWQSGVTHIDHYLDDYITMGAPATNECQYNLSLILDKCELSVSQFHQRNWLAYQYL